MTLAKGVSAERLRRRSDCTEVRRGWEVGQVQMANITASPMRLGFSGRAGKQGQGDGRWWWWFVTRQRLDQSHMLRKKNPSARGPATGV